ncbi:unnamed protein product [Gadus morhua 'NCC']
MVQKHNCQGGKKALCIDTYAMTQIWNRKTAILRKCDPSLYGVILGVVNEPNHWILTVIFPSEQRSLVLDPLGNDASKITRCLETTRAFMRARGCTVSRWKANTVPHSLQQDSTSCGIFAIKMISVSCATTVEREKKREGGLKTDLMPLTGSSVTPVEGGTTRVVLGDRIEILCTAVLHATRLK